MSLILSGAMIPILTWAIFVLIKRVYEMFREWVINLTDSKINSLNRIVETRKWEAESNARDIKYLNERIYEVERLAINERLCRVEGLEAEKLIKRKVTSRKASKGAA